MIQLSTKSIKKSKSKKSIQLFYLRINFIFKAAHNYLIIGNPKSGKTSFLRAILGHMKLL